MSIPPWPTVSLFRHVLLVLHGEGAIVWFFSGKTHTFRGSLVAMPMRLYINYMLLCFKNEDGGGLAFILVETFNANLIGLMDADLNDLKVMIIDGSKTIRRTAEALLSKVGCTVVTATDGFDTLAKIADSRPDVIFVIL